MLQVKYTTSQITIKVQIFISALLVYSVQTPLLIKACILAGFTPCFVITSANISVPGTQHKLLIFLLSRFSFILATSLLSLLFSTIDVDLTASSKELLSTFAVTGIEFL